MDLNGIPSKCILLSQRFMDQARNHCIQSNVALLHSQLFLVEYCFHNLWQQSFCMGQPVKCCSASNCNACLIRLASFQHNLCTWECLGWDPTCTNKTGIKALLCNRHIKHFQQLVVPQTLQCFLQVCKFLDQFPSDDP